MGVELGKYRYKIDTQSGNLKYLAVDINKCPYGGTWNPNEWPHYCYLGSGLAPTQFANGPRPRSPTPCEIGNDRQEMSAVAAGRAYVW